MLKQVIVVRKDLKNKSGNNIRTGKLIAQACHASLGSYLRTSTTVQNAWLHGSKGIKIIVGVDSLEELIELGTKVMEAKIPYKLIQDIGLTEFDIETITALGIGPDEDHIIDPITKHLKLL